MQEIPSSINESCVFNSGKNDIKGFFNVEKGNDIYAIEIISTKELKAGIKRKNKLNYKSAI